MLSLLQVLERNKKILESGLHPVVKKQAQKLIEAAYKRGLLILLTQGHRTLKYQKQLYDQGRITPGEIVTNARPGYSPHNYGLAIDFALLDLITGRKVLWDTRIDQDRDGVADWTEIVTEAKKLGFVWGGDFKKFVDKPHLEMLFGLTINDLLAGKKPVMINTKEESAMCENVVTVKLDKKTLPMKAELRNGVTFVCIGGVWMQAKDLAKDFGGVLNWDPKNKVCTLIV